MNVYFSENKPINKVDSAWFSQAFKKKKTKLGSEMNIAWCLF